MLRVDFTTSSDADFVRGFILATCYPAWDPTIVYAAAATCDYGGQVWTAAAASQNVTPGSDGTKWTATARPPIDLTGSTLFMQARLRATDTQAAFAVTSAGGGSGIVITDAANGKFTLTLPFKSSPTFHAVAAGTYVQSLIRLRPDGLYEREWSGSLTHQIGPTQ